jgi:hypothetical protein
VTKSALAQQFHIHNVGIGKIIRRELWRRVIDWWSGFYIASNQMMKPCFHLTAISVTIPLPHAHEFKFAHELEQQGLHRKAMRREGERNILITMRQQIGFELLSRTRFIRFRDDLHPITLT